MKSGWGAFGAALVVALSSAAGCDRSGPAFESVPELPKEPRRPLGTELELHATLPEGARTGDTRDGVILLEAPVDPARARATVAAFFRALVEESPSALETLLAPQAVVQSGSRREAARPHLHGRFARSDLRSLAGATLYRENEIELWEPRRGPDVTPGAPLEPKGEELVARVRLLTSSASRPRLLGDEFVFRLVPAGSGFVISEIVEEFRGPPP
jgi:hypothetical protein